MIGTDDLVSHFLLANRDHRDANHKSSGLWKASMLGGCMRAQTYNRLKVPSYRSFDAGTLKTFSYGDTLHNWLKRFYRTSGVLLAEEGKLEAPGLDLVGYFDVLLTSSVQDITEEQRERWSPWWLEFVEKLRESARATFPDDGEVVIGEIKSISPYGFKYVRKEPKADHQLQIGAYMLMARLDPDLLPAEPTGGRVIYISKDSKEPILEHDFEEQWAEDAAEIIDELCAYWAKDELPPCTCEGWQLSYCDYLHPDARTGAGKASKLAVAGKHCCSPDLHEPALEAYKSAKAEEGDEAE